MRSDVSCERLALVAHFDTELQGRADSQIAQDVGHLLRPHALRMTAVAVTRRGKEVVALRIGDEPVVPVRKVVFDCAPAQVGILDRAAQLGRWHWLRFRRR